VHAREDVQPACQSEPGEEPEDGVEEDPGVGLFVEGSAGGWGGGGVGRLWGRSNISTLEEEEGEE